MEIPKINVGTIEHTTQQIREALRLDLNRINTSRAVNQVLALGSPTGLGVRPYLHEYNPKGSTPNKFKPHQGAKEQDRRRKATQCATDAATPTPKN